MHECTINSNTHALLPAEYEYLIAALRRDIASERLKAEVRTEWSSYHLMNVRWSVRLLEAFGYQEDDFGRSGGRSATTQADNRGTTDQVPGKGETGID